jgi:IclR family acetate operon transcriptional repressor
MRNAPALESVDNALRLLLLLAERDQVRVSEVSAELGVALSSAHRLLATLKQRDFVAQQPDRSYVRGPAFAQLGGRVPPAPSLEELALPHLQWLRKAADETAHLSVLDGTQMRFLSSVETTRSLRVGSRAGSMLPARQTSGGKAVLATLDPEELSRRLGPGGDLAEGLSPAEVARLLRELGAVRRQGFGVNKAESERGIAAVGVSVLGPGSRPVGALSLSVPTVRLNPARLREMAALLRRAKAALERELAA